MEDTWAAWRVWRKATSSDGPVELPEDEEESVEEESGAVVVVSEPPRPSTGWTERNEVSPKVRIAEKRMAGNTGFEDELKADSRW